MTATGTVIKAERPKQPTRLTGKSTKKGKGGWSNGRRTRNKMTRRQFENILDSRGTDLVTTIKLDQDGRRLKAIARIEEIEIKNPAADLDENSTANRERIRRMKILKMAPTWYQLAQELGLN